MTDNPILDPVKASHVTGDFSPSELQLANRNSGTLLETLRHDITPVGAHYLLNHFDIPFVEQAKDWTLTIDGEFETQGELTLDELMSFPETSTVVTLECAGNGRGLLSPRWPSQPWTHEAVGTAKWTGTALSNLLDHAVPKQSCDTLVFLGADEGVAGGDRHHYGRSLSLQQAIDSKALIVWSMNDMPLTPQHGFPLRLIVPGWYGMASVKWLTRIIAQSKPFDGHQQVKTYWIKDKHGEKVEPITTIKVRSLLIPPGIPDWATRRRLVDAGKITLHGRAWSGAGIPVEKVEVAIDGDWQLAQLETASSTYAWSSWHHEWTATSGKHRLSCRATDADGQVQPVEAQWEYSGFCNNACQHVDVWVV